jgi:RNA polymerase sigma-70 factor (ECF subfamily)
MTCCDDQSDTQLLEQASCAADSAVVRQLLQRHRNRLRRMLAVHMDPRLRARIDPSDIIQDTLLRASQKLQDYLRDRPLPFYPWLRQIAWDQLIQLHRRHLGAYKRTAAREATQVRDSRAGRTMMNLAEQLAASVTSPSARMAQDELRHRMRAALVRLPQTESDVLVLRYLEQLTIKEIAVVLGITEAAAGKRHFRGLERLRATMAAVETG